MGRVVLTAQFTIRATFVYAVTAEMTESFHPRSSATMWMMFGAAFCCEAAAVAGTRQLLPRTAMAESTPGERRTSR
jgi:hypothetical protein